MAAKPLIVANWKLNPETFREAKVLFDATRKAAEKTKRANVVVAPPALFLHELRARYKGRALGFAAQDGSAEPLGAHTGDISMAQLKHAGAAYVIIGHSERRAKGETDEDTRRKVAASLDAKLTPILCVGERARDASGSHFNFVREQLHAALGDIAPEKLGKLVIAYEPVWAIGGEQAMQPHDIHQMAIFIRKAAVGVHGDAARTLRVIYGGSTNEENARAILDEGDVQGLLPGHVSLDATRFTALLTSL